MATIDVLHFSDPGCPWAYSAWPALRVLQWRFGDGLRWRLALIGLTEQREQYERRGYTPAMMARGYARFRRYGMPFATAPKPRPAATSPACRVVVAARLRAPGRELEVFRALQLSQFTTTRLLDDPGDLRTAVEAVPGVDAAGLVNAIDDDDVHEAYEADRALARTAAGSPTEAMGRAAQTDGVVRYTAPSLVFELDGRRLDVGGFQPVEAYDACIANLAPDLPRRPEAQEPAELLAAFPEGLTTAEVAALMCARNEAPDRAAAEGALIDLAADGGAERVAVGNDALWRATAARRPSS